jgi:hypothetical protein
MLRLHCPSSWILGLPAVGRSPPLPEMHAPLYPVTQELVKLAGLLFVDDTDLLAMGKGGPRKLRR